MKTVVIFGGSGFIGQHIIRRIAKIGYRIIIPHQQQTNEAKLRLLGVIGQIFGSLMSHEDIVRRGEEKFPSNGSQVVVRGMAFRYGG